LAANAEKPLPAFLMNAGQCYRKSGDSAKALALYEEYLAQAANDDPWRPKIRKLVAELRAERRAPTVNVSTEAPRTSPPAAEPQARRPAAAPAPSPVKSDLDGSATATLQERPPEAAPAPPRRRRLVQRGWFWGAVLGGAVVVGGAIALAVTLGNTKDNPVPGL